MCYLAKGGVVIEIFDLAKYQKGRGGVHFCLSKHKKTINTKNKNKKYNNYSILLCYISLMSINIPKVKKTNIYILYLYI